MALIMYRRRALDLKGVLTAIFLLPLITLSGFQSFIIMLSFLISSSLVTFAGFSLKEARGASENKSGRSWQQVIGAGFVAVLFSFLYFLSNLYNDNYLSTALLMAYLVAVAIANADTWAAEIGSLSKNPPRLIIKPWKKVPHGVSGGVTLRGEVAAVSGSFFIGIVSLVIYLLSKAFHLSPWSNINMDILQMLCLITVFGWLGEIIDSIIGATLQVKYYCTNCNKISDKKIHRCGAKTVYLSGIKFITNEVTNIISGLVTTFLLMIYWFFI